MKKKLLEVILTIIAVIAFVLMTGECGKAGLQVLWTLGWAGILVGCCKGLERLGKFNS
jgi:hypothetical protein